MKITGENDYSRGVTITTLQAPSAAFPPSAPAIEVGTIEERDGLVRYLTAAEVRRRTKEAAETDFAARALASTPAPVRARRNGMSRHWGSPVPGVCRLEIRRRQPRPAVAEEESIPTVDILVAVGELRGGGIVVAGGEVFTAELPPEAGKEKYDAKAGAMIGLLKYGSGLPFNRWEGLQGNLEIPLPASTQWDVISTFAPMLNPAFEAFIREAAQGDVVYNDDTTVKILALMGERRIPFEDDPGRTGLPRRRHRDRVPPPLEALGDRLGQVLVIVDDQDAQRFVGVGGASSSSSHRCPRRAVVLS